jgi:hypothetical protein
MPQVRVNMEMLRATRTKEQKQRTQRISVGITFTKDNWETRQEKDTWDIPKSIHINML